MMNQIFRITFVTFIYKRYKQTILSTALLLLVLWLIEKIHQDFVNYSQLNEDTSFLAVSFGLKWFAFACVTGLYTAWNLFFKRESFKKESLSKAERKKYGQLLNDEDELEDDLIAKMRAIPISKVTAKTTEKEPQNEKDGEDAKPDPFAQIRDKETLKSKADFVLHKKPK
ncbi:hypothetical protein TW85_17785 [Marinomonas sp. S3726]|uniref:hypothetical protein n=1 Tax=Marinomonas sp. S3726 TaxID=579484 RepID=UPI0005F9BA8F|nr:hypothetical protein [Marinomonas sp. S3726]KJZ10922.1 hypothetical protein TW85_17785 [Marinomonas sp. S3726]